MRKFTSLYESFISRYTRGGFLTGDIVKLKEGALKNEWFKKQGNSILEKAKQFAESGLLMRVSAVKTNRPSVQPGFVEANNADDFYCDITLEMAPGLYKDFITLPASILEYKDYYPNLPEVPDALKRPNDSNIKPKEIEEEKEKGTAYLNPAYQTSQTDKGDGKNTPSEIELKNTNVKIPSKPAEGSKNPSVASYTHNYLPSDQ
ncbi:hypothetical protein EBR43_03340 [bacterium]|nr:hypothetical protein [bacterium]